MPPGYVLNFAPSHLSLYHRIHAYGTPQLPYRNIVELNYPRVPWQTQTANLAKDNDSNQKADSGDRFLMSNRPWNETPSTPGLSEESLCVSK